jgi:acyl carrier protein
MLRSMNERIREIIRVHGQLPGTKVPSDDADLYAAGLTSHASVSVMLALEEAFDVEFPDRMLTRSVFSSVSSIASALTELQGDVVA